MVKFGKEEISLYNEWINVLRNTGLNSFGNKTLKISLNIENDELLRRFGGYVKRYGFGNPLYAGNQLFLLTLKE